MTAARIEQCHTKLEYLSAESAVGESEAGEWEAESKMPTADGRTVFTFLTRPLPTYALEHYFGKCGLVDSVCLQAPDERYGIVRYTSNLCSHSFIGHKVS